MPAISLDEARRRHQSMESVLGTHAMEGLFPDAVTRETMRRYEAGELTPDEFSAAMDAHAYTLVAERRALAGAA